ncbi:MAG TPA: glycosyltransferase family 39 protein [Acidimicrobiales bacterium]|nr:glycosyltransferase family 39 protein [Acidimicrobiales bacterium]
MQSGLACLGASDPREGGGALTSPEAVTERLPSRSIADRRPGLLRHDRWAVGALMLLAAVLRVPNLGRSYWIDESISIGIASHRLSHMPTLLRHDGSPPLFYFLLHFWLRLFGSSEVATHVLPLLISLAAIPLAYWAGQELFDRRAGLAAAALMATNPFLNWYATETRMYTLVVVLSTLGVTFAWRAFRDRRPADAGAAVGAFAALLYTHDWGIYLTAATVAVFLWKAWARRDRTLAGWVVGCGAATLLLWAPWIPSFLYQAGNTAAPWAVRPQIGDFFADPASALGGTLGFLILPLLVIGAWACRDLISTGDRRIAWSIAAVALVTAVLGFAGAQVDPSWTVRYLAVIIAPALLAAAGALASTGRGRTVLLAGCSILALWAVVGLLLPNPNGRYAKDNMGAVARAAAPLLKPGDVVIVTQTEQVPVAYRYLPRGLLYMTPTGPVADPSVVDWRNIIHRLQQTAPCQALSPTLDALPVGTTVLEIDPVRFLGARSSAWARAVNGQVEAVDLFLRDDPALKQAGLYTPGLRPRPYAPVDGIVFQKTSRTPSCA